MRVGASLSRALRLAFTSHLQKIKSDHGQVRAFLTAIGLSGYPFGAAAQGPIEGVDEASIAAEKDNTDTHSYDAEDERRKVLMPLVQRHLSRPNHYKKSQIPLVTSTNKLYQ